MVNLFYGVSVSDGNDEVKEVTIFNPSREIMPGDLLAIYFSHGNTYNAPTLLISETSSLDEGEEQVSNSEDTGYEIKTRNVEADVDYMWQSGEVCLFVLTSQQFNSDVNQEYDSIHESESNNALYYMLIRGSRSTSEWYGLTKLFTDEFPISGSYSTFREWLAADDPDDKTTAATPYLLKQLSNFIIGKIEEESGDDPDPTPAPSSPSIVHYQSKVDEGQEIGILQVGNQPYSILIPSSGGSGGSDTGYTSGLTNDADIVRGKHERIKNARDGDYFITNVVDRNLYLYKTSANDSPKGIYIAQDTSSVPDITTKVEGSLGVRPILTSITQNGSTNITELNSGFPTSALNIYGSPIRFRTNSTPVFTMGAGGINKSELNLYAPSFYEDGVSLSNKYSKKLVIKTFIIGNGSYSYYDNGWHVTGKTKNGKGYAIEIDSEKNCPHSTTTITTGLSGLTPLGIMGYNLDRVTSTSDYTPAGGDGDASYQMVWELYLTDRKNGSATVNYCMRNLRNQKVSFTMVVYILCVTT